MPHVPIRRRKGDPAEPPQLEELLGAGAASPAISAEWQPVSELLRAASGSATASELESEAATLAAFRRAHIGVPARRPFVARPRMMGRMLSGRIAAVIACAAIGVTGATGAAFAGVLPNPIQNFAHATIGAPESDAVSVAADHHSTAPEASGNPSPEASHSEASTGPEPTKSLTPSERARHASASAKASATASAAADARAAAALCHAWSEALAPGAHQPPAPDQHGVLDQVAQRAKLVALAGGADKITAFCATVKHNNENQSGSQTPAPSATGVQGDGVLDGKPGTHGGGPNNNNLFGNFGFGNSFGNGFGSGNGSGSSGGHAYANGAAVHPHV
jgi:hypothetical protein